MRELVDQLLAAAGIEPGGPNPWDIQIHDPAFYRRVWAGRNLGLGESYVDGWWDSQQLDEFFARLLRSGIEQGLRLTPSLALRASAHRIFNFQNKVRSREVIEKHYDLGNDLFQAMLDSRMNYSCGYWKGARSLEEAQVHKLELVCQKLLLKPGMRLLDIGCGWGALAKHAAQHYGATVLGITLSQPQKLFAEESCRGLSVTFQVQDYRDLPGQEFDRVVSIGMFEHVGHKNARRFLDIVRNAPHRGRDLPPAYHRRELVPVRGGSLDRQIHLPQRRAAFPGPDQPRDGRTFRPGGLAQFRQRL